MAFERSERPGGRGGRKGRRKVCQFCVDKIDSIDYKDVARLRRFMSERAKILPRRVTGTCAPPSAGPDRRHQTRPSDCAPALCERIIRF